MSKASPAALVLTVLCSAGCSYLGSARDFDPAEFSRDPRWVRAGDVPLILQRSEKDCGAAAAAMVLAHWKRSDTLEDVSAALPPDPPHGHKGGDLKKLFEQRKLRAYAISGATEHIVEQLSNGRPAIVGLVKPAITGPMTHYEVVVAYHPVDNRVVTLDPARGWRENTLDGFLNEWDPAKRTMIVAFEMR